MKVERIGEGHAALPVPSAMIETHFGTLGSDSNDVAQIEEYIRAAALEIENTAGVCLLSDTIWITLDKFPFDDGVQDDWWSGVRQMPAALLRKRRPIALPYGPVPAAPVLVARAIQDGETISGVVAATDFWVEAGSLPKLHLKSTSELTPSYFRTGGQVQIEYPAGYGVSDVDVPADLRLAVADQALRMYERRGDELAGSASLSPTARRIVARYSRPRL